jgi:hypothetical protein
MSLLTVSLGVLPGEAAAAGVDFKTRGRRADDAVGDQTHARRAIARDEKAEADPRSRLNEPLGHSGKCLGTW